MKIGFVTSEDDAPAGQMVGAIAQLTDRSAEAQAVIDAAEDYIQSLEDLPLLNWSPGAKALAAALRRYKGAI